MPTPISNRHEGQSADGLSRRSFLRSSAVVASGLAALAASFLLGGMIGQDFWLGPRLSLGVALHLAGGSVAGTPSGPASDPRIGTTFGTGQLLVSLLYN